MKTFSSLAVWLVAAGAAGTLACGSGGSDNCGQVSPCGGDVVGTWSWTRACPNAAAYTAQADTSCRGSFVTSISQAVGGSITFNADLTFRLENASSSLVTNHSFPLESQAVAACADLDRHDASNTQTIDTTCTGTTTCTCDSTVATFGQTATGSYSTAGSALTLILGTVTTTTGYCVERNRLHQIAFASAGSNGQQMVLSDSVAERLTR